MPPKRKHSSSAASLTSMREVVALHFAPTADPTGALEDDAAPPPLEIRPVTTAPIATDQSIGTSTATTGRSLPRSIRCKSRGDSTSNSTSTSATRTRGICVCRKTHEEVRKTGKKITFPWSDELKLPSDQYYQGRFARDLGSIVRDAVPMMAASYWDLSEEDKMIVFNNIYTYYDVSLEQTALLDYIQTSAALRYKDWMSDCRCHFEKYGSEVPREFVHRVEQWTWLTNHFSTEEDKVLSQRMKMIRASQNKVNHTSGPTLFAYRAKKLKEKRDKAPILNAWADAYAKNAPDKADAMRSAAKASIASFESSNPTPPPMEDGSDSIAASISLPLQTQIEVLQGKVGVRRGTVIRGMGSGYKKDPQTRGGARPVVTNDGDLRSTVEMLKEDNEGLRQRMAEQEEARLQTQQEMADLQRQVLELLRRDASGGSSTFNQQP